MSLFSFHQQIHTQNGTRTISVNIGDLCKSEEEYDVIVVSSFQRNYYPLNGTMIGALDQRKNISVSDLSQNPEIDLRESKNVWLSKETHTNFHRVACINCFLIAVPLLSNIIRLFDQIPELESVDFYEINAQKADYLAEVVHKYNQPFPDAGNKDPDSSVPDLFISYSSRQRETADEFLPALSVSA